MSLVIPCTFPAAAGYVASTIGTAVILSILIQGSTLGPIAKWLGLSEPARPRALFSLEMITKAQSDYDIVVIDLPGPEGTPGPRIRDLRLPEGAIITLISRAGEVVLPKGETRQHSRLGPNLGPRTCPR